jgi:tetratricopeptide (TPR) repeat protein
MKANAYISYERDCPDMALANIMGLAYDYKTSRSKWLYSEQGAVEPIHVDDEMFAGMMQEYCYSLYALGSRSSYEAFLKLSTRLNEYFPKNADFIANIGSYHMVVDKDYKTALKYYDKALKLQPDNASVLHNALLASRKLQNKKLEKKYLKMSGN